jgi:hypothetical protein
MSLPPIAEKIKSVLAFLLAWSFLNVLMNIKYPAQQMHMLTLFKVSPEVLGIMMIPLATAWMGLRFHPALYLPLTAFVIFLRLFRIGDILVPMYFFRPFNLFLDAQFVPDLIHLLYTTFSLKIFTVAAIITVILLAGISWGVWLSFKTIHNFLAYHRNRRIVLVLIAAGLMVLPYLPAGGIRFPGEFFAKGFFHRVVEEFNFILHVKGHRARQLGVIESAMKAGEQIPSSLDKLHSADVFIFFVESYGHTIFAERRHFQKIEPVLDAIEENLENRGFLVSSTFFNSPTYGGTSWLAHATLAGGVKLNSHMHYNLMITSKAKTMAHFFNAAGYRTVSATPGTQWPWPQGAFFEYQKKYYAWNFEYKGPMYGWSTMPDQYVLDYIYRHEIQNRTQPLFIEFILVTSHAPFHRQPPYLKDWSRIGTGEIYHQMEAVTFPIVWPDLSNATQGYVTAIIYEFNAITDFIMRYLDDNALIIVLGDHQPNVQITGENQPWSVPVHVISRNNEFMEPFRKRGYSPGLIPTQPPPHRGMETFLYDFLADFSTPDRLTKDE